MRRFFLILAALLGPVVVFAAMVWADHRFGAPGRGQTYVIQDALPPLGGEIGLPPIEGPMDPSRPLVVIDAGHGGHDPGAGQDRIKEKDLVLGLALALRDELLRQGGIRVALTRSGDTFLELPERNGIARRMNADLFLSIHADSTEGAAANGATVYTLSSKGTNEVAERLAQRENRSGPINGVAFDGQDEAVSAILVDLSQRDTQARSEEFAALILREGEGRMRFRETTVQAAAFAVLKSPDVPSVLLESGYINSPEDFARLASESGKGGFGKVVARAMAVYFARRSLQ